MKQRKIKSIVLMAIMLSSVTLGIITEAIADNPKTIIGTLYIDEGKGYEIADVGIDMKIIIEGETYYTTTVEWNNCNYIFDIPLICEGKTGYFFVGNDLVPIDNKSIIIGSDIEYWVDLQVIVPILTGNFPPFVPFDQEEILLLKVTESLAFLLPHPHL